MFKPPSLGPPYLPFNLLTDLLTGSCHIQGPVQCRGERTGRPPRQRGCAVLQCTAILYQCIGKHVRSCIVRRPCIVRLMYCTLLHCTGPCTQSAHANYGTTAFVHEQMDTRVMTLIHMTHGLSRILLNTHAISRASTHGYARVTCGCMDTRAVPCRAEPCDASSSRAVRAVRGLQNCCLIVHLTHVLYDEISNLNTIRILFRLTNNLYYDI